MTGSFFQTIRSGVDGFWEQLLGDKPSWVNPNLRNGITIVTFWATDQTGATPDVGVQLVAKIYPAGGTSQVATGNVQFVGGRFVTSPTGGSVVSPPSGTPPLASVAGVTDGTGSATFVFPGIFDVTQPYWITISTQFPDHPPGPTYSFGLLPSPGADWGGATGSGFVYGNVLAQPSVNVGPMSGPSGSDRGGPPHHGRTP